MGFTFFFMLVLSHLDLPGYRCSNTALVETQPSTCPRDMDGLFRTPMQLDGEFLERVHSSHPTSMSSLISTIHTGMLAHLLPPPETTPASALAARAPRLQGYLTAMAPVSSGSSWSS